MQKLISEIICQQDIRRFFCSDEICLFLCARCSGIYLGFTVSFLGFYLANVKIQTREIIISSFFILLLLLSILLKPYGFDNNMLRYISGVLTGIACASFCLAAFHFSVSKPYNTLMVLLFYAVSILLSLLLLYVNYNLLNYCILIAFSLFCCLSNAALIKYIGNLNNQKAILISIPLSIIELFFIQLIKY